MEVGIRKGAWQRDWRYPAYLWSLSRNPQRLVYAVYPQYTMPTTPRWDIHARVYPRAKALSCGTAVGLTAVETVLLCMCICTNYNHSSSMLHVGNAIVGPDRISIPGLSNLSVPNPGFRDRKTGLEYTNWLSHQKGKWEWHTQLKLHGRFPTCIWPSWCRCHSLSLASVNSRSVLPFWYRLTRVVPDKGPLNVRVCVPNK